jgi:hypothetical protein
MEDDGTFTQGTSMRLDPVYVVAPRVASPSMPTRRAFLLASGTFAVGATLGGACGYAVGSHAAPAADPSKAPPPAEPAVDEPLKPSGDVELDELRHLAVKAPIEELAKNDLLFLTYFGRRYRTDQILWRGVERLAVEVLRRQDYPQRRIVAKAIVQVAEQGEAGLKKLIGDKLEVLGAIK